MASVGMKQLWTHAEVRLQLMIGEGSNLLSDRPCEPKGSPFNPMLSLSSIEL